MPLSLPQWFTRPKGKKTTPPTSAELTEQLQQADADVAEAEARETAAAEREATERTPEAVEAYEAVRVEADRLRRFRSRLRADLEAAREREAEAERKRKEARIEELRALIHDGDTRLTAQLVEREVAALRELADVRYERIELSRQLERYGAERRALRGETRAYGPVAQRAAAGWPVVERVEREIAKLPAGDPRRRLLYRLTEHWRRWYRDP